MNLKKKNTKQKIGLLSIHILAEKFQHKLKNKYNGIYLDFAKQLADKLMPAFDTPSGIPYARERERERERKKERKKEREREREREK